MTAAHDGRGVMGIAPGASSEFLLASDGANGVARMSGTSFAAPLVSGTVALMHDRWPWLRDKPAATVSILLNSARDVGAPGVDPVYGRGMLDVQAALWPEDWNKLKFKVGTVGAKLEDLKIGAIGSAQREQMIQNWEANGFYVTVFDNKLDTYRDFNIPLSTKLAGQTVGTKMEQFNGYLTQRFYEWFRGGGITGGKAGPGFAFGPARFSSAMPAIGGLAATVTATPRLHPRPAPVRPALRHGAGARQ